jgi:Lrp/AsnC family leucine-responsive transcriptional regulator
MGNYLVETRFIDNISIISYFFRRSNENSDAIAYLSEKNMMLASLDSDDIRILQLLQYDARLNTKEIADKLGKSPTSVYERVKKLESAGIIEKYVALLNKNLIGKSLIAFINVKVKEHSQNVLKSFHREVVKFAEVMESYHLTGEWDFLLKVAIYDMPEYDNFLMYKLATLPNIQTVQSFFVLSEGKRDTAYAMKLPAPKKTAKKK